MPKGIYPNVAPPNPLAGDDHDRPLSFHHDHDPPMNPLPHQGSHAQKREVIERGRTTHPGYAKAYREHGERLRAKGLLK
jgi:hypothetical protein